MNPSVAIARLAWPDARIQEGRADQPILVIHSTDTEIGRLFAVSHKVARMVELAEKAVCERHESRYGDALIDALGLSQTFIQNDGKYIARIALAPIEARVKALLSLCPKDETQARKSA